METCSWDFLKGYFSVWSIKEKYRIAVLKKPVVYFHNPLKWSHIGSPFNFIYSEILN